MVLDDLATSDWCELGLCFVRGKKAFIRQYAWPTESCSHVNLSYSTDMPSNLGNMLGLRNHVRDRHIHEQLKYDLIENIWNKFGNDEYV